MHPEFDLDAITSLEILNSHGYEAYIVGGAVRDYFLNCTNNDYDIVTNANLDEIMNIFSGYKNKLYANNQCVGVKLNEKYIEISTFKGNNLIDDLYNRDFSINSIAYNPKVGFVDPYNGIDDIKNKILRTVNIEEKVFKADPLRLLRAIRFEIIYNLNPTKELCEAIIKYAELLKLVHPMRIPHELDKILLSDNPGFYITKYKKVFFAIIPHLSYCDSFDQHSKWHSYNVFDHIMKVVDSTEKDLVLRLSALFHDIKKPECFTLDINNEGHFYNHYVKSSIYANEILTNLSYNKILINRVCHLVLFHETRLKIDKRLIINFLIEFGLDDLDLFFKLQKADIMGQNPDLLYRLKEYDKLEDEILKIVNTIDIITLKKLRININDFKELGYSEDKAKKKLVEIAFMATTKEIINDRDILLEYINKRFNKN